MPNLNFCEIHQTIKKAKNILLVAHGQPDVDTTASVCALKEYFISANIESTVYCADPIPAHFNFMPSAMTAINKTQLKFNEYDVVIICDCGSIKKTTLITEINNKLKGQTIINIDHHPQVDHFFDINMRDIEASSTCEIIYNFLIANNLNINKKIAECLLAGIISDTKNFLYTKKNSANLLMSARLLEKGANWSKIMTAIHYNKDLNSLKLWGETMISIKLNKKYNIISSNITLDKMQSVDGEVLEGLPSFLGTIGGVKGIILLKEEAANTIRGSLRSFDDTTNMALLASSLGGGGHIKAAGFKVRGRLVKQEKQWAIIDNTR